MEAIEEQIEQLRQQLYQALDDAGGDHQDVTVQRIARAFDELLNDYMTRNYAVLSNLRN